MQHTPHAEVPVIDIAGLYNGNTAATVEQIGNACQMAGCFIALHHGVPGQLLHSAEREARRFFALPEATKKTFSGSSSAASLGCGRGYFHAAALAAEGMDIGPESSRAPFGRCGAPRGADNHWPSPALLPDWKLIMQWYYVAMEALCTSLVGALARYLGIRADDCVAASHDNPPVLRLWHWTARGLPPATDKPAGENGAPDCASLRASGLTLLYADRPGYLQTGDARGTLRALPAVEDGVVVMLGDAWQRWPHSMSAGASYRPSGDPRNGHALAFLCALDDAPGRAAAQRSTARVGLTPYAAA